MFIEDLITRVGAVEYLFNGQDRKFVRSITRRVETGAALTTRQGWAFLSIARKNPVHSEVRMKKEAYYDLLSNPVWRTPLVPSVELRSECRHLGDNLLGFRTSNGRTEIEFAAIRAVYSNGMKIIPVENTAQLNAVIDFIGKWNFAIDPATESYLAQAMEHATTSTSTLVEDDNIYIDVPNQHVFAQFAQHVLGARIL